MEALRKRFARALETLRILMEERLARAWVANSLFGVQWRLSFAVRTSSFELQSGRDSFAKEQRSYGSAAQASGRGSPGIGI